MARYSTPDRTASVETPECWRQLASKFPRSARGNSWDSRDYQAMLFRRDQPYSRQAYLGPTSQPSVRTMPGRDSPDFDLRAIPARQSTSTGSGAPTGKLAGFYLSL